MKIILEMANNHMGDVSHGEKIIAEYSKIARHFNSEIDFLFKFQFRHLDTFIHDDFKGSDLKFVRRFEDTVLTDEQWTQLFDCCRDNGFKIMVTPFDEISVSRLLAFGVDELKVASCSLGDWPLMERISKEWDGPVTVSTAGASLETIDSVVTFFKNRALNPTIMHCVGLYPTASDRLELGQISFFKQYFRQSEIGYSTHEHPGNFSAGALALALGATVFEKHVGLASQDYSVNDYSTTPAQFEQWVRSIVEAKTSLGSTNKRRQILEDESSSLLALRRGAYLKKALVEGSEVGDEDVYFAIPVNEGQVTANDWSKYSRFSLVRDLEAGAQLLLRDVEVSSNHSLVKRAHDAVMSLINESGVLVPHNSELELSHHFGLESFCEFGLAMITVVNSGYCKKILVSLPGQKHPEQYHKLKTETFHILWGDLTLVLDGCSHQLVAGSVVTIQPGQVHEFSSEGGAVVEEISSTHFGSDSYYVDDRINQNQNRKTYTRI